VEDPQPEGQLEYEGPTWSGGVGLQRRLTRTLGVEVAYRQLRVEWDSRSDSLDGTSFSYHLIGVGLFYALPKG